MLNYFHNKIFFNFEVGKCENYICSRCAFCEEGDVQNFFPNIQTKTNMSTKELTGRRLNIALSAPQFFTFVKQWDAQSEYHKLYEWNIEEWIEDYIKDIKHASDVMDGQYNEDVSVFLKKKIEYVKNLQYFDVITEYFFNFENKLKPEFSWCVEDCLYHLLQGTTSKYESYVNHVIQMNILTENTFKSIQSAIFPYAKKEKKRKHIKLSTFKDMTKDEIFTALYSMYSSEIIRTNITHLKKCIDIYCKQRKV